MEFSLSLALIFASCGIAFILSLFKEERSCFKAINNIFSFMIFGFFLYSIWGFLKTRDYRGWSAFTSVGYVFLSFFNLVGLAVQRFLISFLKKIRGNKNIKIINLIMVFFLLSPILFSVLGSYDFLKGIILIISLFILLVMVILGSK